MFLQALLATSSTPLWNKSPINSIPVYSNCIFYCFVKTILYSSYSCTAFTPLQELMAISSTPLWKLIFYSLQFSMRINTHFFHYLTAFNFLQELMLISSTPLQKSMLCSFYSSVFRSTSNLFTPQSTIWALLSQE